MIVLKHLSDDGKTIIGDDYKGKDGRRHVGRLSIYLPAINPEGTSVRYTIFETSHDTTKLEIKATLFDKHGARMVLDSQEFYGHSLASKNEAEKYARGFIKTLERRVK